MASNPVKLVNLISKDLRLYLISGAKSLKTVGIKLASMEDKKNVQWSNSIE